MEELIPITMFMCVAAVLILRPLTKKLGVLLEAMTRERTHAGVEDTNTARIIGLMEHMNRRLDQIEERLDFTERLVSSRAPSMRRPLHAARTPTLGLEVERGEYVAR